MGSSSTDGCKVLHPDFKISHKSKHMDSKQPHLTAEAHLVSFLCCKILCVEKLRAKNFSQHRLYFTSAETWLHDRAIGKTFLWWWVCVSGRLLSVMREGALISGSDRACVWLRKLNGRGQNTCAPVLDLFSLGVDQTEWTFPNVFWFLFHISLANLVVCFQPDWVVD